MLMKAEKYHRNRFSNTAHIYEVRGTMGLLPNTSHCGCACAGNAANVFPATAGKQSWHASRHVRDASAVMHAGIANSRFPLNSAAGENVPGIPGACATRSCTYLVRGPYKKRKFLYSGNGAVISSHMVPTTKLNMPVFLPLPLAIIISNCMKLADEISRNIAAIRVLNTDIGYVVGSLFPSPVTTIVRTPVTI